ncbi:MAG: hypothetical protein AAGI38_02745 [Bacteroidota bacterium]
MSRQARHNRADRKAQRLLIFKAPFLTPRVEISLMRYCCTDRRVRESADKEVQDWLIVPAQIFAENMRVGLFKQRGRRRTQSRLALILQG